MITHFIEFDVRPNPTTIIIIIIMSLQVNTTLRIIYTIQITFARDIYQHKDCSYTFKIYIYTEIQCVTEHKALYRIMTGIYALSRSI